MSKHIALVGNSAATMYNFRGDLIRDLVKAGYRVTIIAPIDRDIHIYQELGASFIPIHIDCKGTNPIKDLRLSIQLYKIYRKKQFDHIFHYTIKPVIYGSPSAHYSHTPQTAVVTGLGYTFIKSGILNQIVRAMYRNALKHTQESWFLNSDDRELFVSLKLIAPSKARVINGEGINLQHFLPKQTQESQFSFLFIGRLLTDKGIREYVDAATVLKKKYPQINFNILGPLNSNNPTAITPEELQNWTETGYVTYLGETNNVIPFIEQASCIVLPSYREGISRVLLEASAMQCPIVTTNTTGCRDIVTDGINGLLCEPKDTLSLTQAMEKMLLLPELERQAMGKKGREIVLNTFDQKIITDIYLDTLK